MSASIPLAPGAVLGDDFSILGPLGAGGMGIVYRAEQLSTGRLRAVKVMQPKRATDEEQRRRFVQEARVGARIASDHVVEVIAAGVDERSGTPWLAMELLEGEDLGAYVERKGPLSVAETEGILAETCHALAAAHSVGVVHRDVKPANVFLAQSHLRRGGSVVKVLDFGLASLVAEAGSDLTGGTGTPLWMAPEQAELAYQAYPASDVWALGLLAFYLLTARVYWKSEVGAPAATLREVLIDPLPAASHRLAELIRRSSPPDPVELPAGFDEWFARCVDRDLARRFPGAGEAWAALAPLLRSTTSGAVSLATLSTLPEAASTPHAAGSFGERTPKPPLGSPPPPSALALASTESVLSAARTVSEVLKPVAPAQRRWPLRLAVTLGGLVMLGGGAAGIYMFATDDDRAIAGSAGPSARGSAAASSPEAAVKVRMVRFEEGDFAMGASDVAATAKKVHVAPFALDATEVTMAAYAACTNAGKCTQASIFRPCSAGYDRPNHPVTCVTLAQARAYCAWLRKRLPTEQEWEFAARGDRLRRYPWGDAKPEGRHLCWHRLPAAVRNWNDEDISTCPVGSSPDDTTPEGVKDMAGNVSEWTESLYSPFAQSKSDAKQYVTRGGSWVGAMPVMLDAWFRFPADAASVLNFIGFRCAASIPS